jgi:anti-anti-sigma factor
VEVHPEGSAVVECTGEHDLTTKTEVAALLKRLLAHYELVVVDISEATFIDASFIVNLFIANRLAGEQGKRFRVQHSTSPIVQRMLESSGVLARLDCATTRQEALR